MATSKYAADPHGVQGVARDLMVEIRDRDKQLDTLRSKLSELEENHTNLHEAVNTLIDNVKEAGIKTCFGNLD